MAQTRLGGQHLGGALFRFAGRATACNQLRDPSTDREITPALACKECGYRLRASRIRSSRGAQDGAS